MALTADADDNDQMSTRLRLLTDCRTAFGTAPALPTDPEAPWHDYGPNGLTTMKLGTILREYEIRSGNIRYLDGTQAKGYQRADFTDAWARYCPEIAPPEGENAPGEPGSRASLVIAGQRGTARNRGTA
ncbi:DUF3631 domain-containing protein [Spirillospora sp. NPDC049024]